MKFPFRLPVWNHSEKVNSHYATTENKRRVALMVSLSIIGIFFLIIFGIIAWLQHNIPLFLFDIGVSVLLLLNLYDLKRRRNDKFNIAIGIIFISILYIFLYASGGVNKTAFVWYFTYPLISCYLLGSFYGGIATVLMTTPVLAIIIVNPQNGFFADYDLNFEGRFLAAYIVVGFFSYLFESSGEKNRRELSAINQNLENTIAERTLELTDKNKQLENEIEERKIVEESLQLSQDSLIAIMESIDATIYVADMENCKILFMNKHMKNIYGKDLTGEICWSAFRNDTGPCAHCRNKNLLDANGEPAGLISWEGYNPIVNKWYLNYDRAIKWVDGRYVHLQIATDITQMKKLEEERKRMEHQLLRAQKMEAIGTLAGGVAHDLNNVLSGIVSYPDLLLLDLPDDSPFKEPLMMIQKSGQKASEIVQDLLTLARRGVTALEILNLNDVILDYLQSPECLKLISYHPNVAIKPNLCPELLNMKGSPLHLRKTVMNLVSNAAEAQPDGGEIIISTNNQNLDLAHTDYEKMDEGDYVLLTVSDKGTGISNEDLNRIFEPFYTKKKMGRSGTGLGMSVVWGAVQDHSGYINVESKQNEGTTFSIYFPITRETVDREEHFIPIEEYKGNGQLVLIVDDVEEQREIAKGYMSKLNYKAVTVSSGEEAIEYLSKNQVDIIILDMIMEPGIDGLETYKKILANNPNQKAIIASGFSETKRVKQAQQLGAGDYIKKPYTLEKIGLAVRNELKKTSQR